jgi:ribosomal protein S18 acetylase RimI-like enzyme
MSEGMVESPVVITGAAGLTPIELAEVHTLKAVCDAADGLDLKLTWGDVSGETEQVFLARAGERLVGFCSLDGDGLVAELCGMVAPSARRAGTGIQLFEAARITFKNGGGEQLYAICEDTSAAGRAFISALGAQRAFAEYRMELPADMRLASDDALTVHELTPDDEETLAAAARITGAGFARPFELTLRGMRDELGHPNERLYLAKAGGEPVGAFKLYSDGATTGIYAFTVDPARQREGWGRRMLARACALAREHGAERVTLEVDTTNTRAIALYTSSGFETITTYGYYLFSRSLLAAGHTGIGPVEMGDE